MHRGERLFDGNIRRLLFAILVVAAVGACTSSAAGGSVDGQRPSSADGGNAPLPLAVASARPTAIVEPSDAVYPWRPTASAGDRLDQRFEQLPAGYARVAVTKGSFPAFLRSLPLKPEGSPVVDYQGRALHEAGRHPNIAAVADLDVGDKDLQHCADVIVRLHAEWRYGRGERDLVYRAVSGQPLSYQRYMSGDRSIVSGGDLSVQRLAATKKDDHALFRAWLDDVFAWAGTASIGRDGAKVAPDDVRAGDFFVMSGTPFGHAVIVLDVAKDERGRYALLLGQSYMPAQSFQVLRPRAAGPSWFLVDPREAGAEVVTPFWRPFPLGSLRRFRASAATAAGDAIPRGITDSGL